MISPSMVYSTGMRKLSESSLSTTPFSSLSAAKWLSIAENGREIIKQRKERIKHLADDLPKVAKAYKEFKEGRV